MPATLSVTSKPTEYEIDIPHRNISSGHQNAGLTIPKQRRMAKHFHRCIIRRQCVTGSDMHTYTQYPCAQNLVGTLNLNAHKTYYFV